MNLTKKQVKAFLEVLSSDESRPVLTHAKIDMLDGTPVLIGTDSYKLAALKLTDDILPEMGSLVPRESLVKWYKLASNKDYLTEVELITMAIPEEEVGKYPEWQRLVPDVKDIVDLPNIRINAGYMFTLQTLVEMPGLEWEFYGPLAPVVSRYNGNLLIVMPLKK